MHQAFADIENSFSSANRTISTSDEAPENIFQRTTRVPSRPHCLPGRKPSTPSAVALQDTKQIQPRSENPHQRRVPAASLAQNAGGHKVSNASEEN
jgi:hypothetical protein